MIRAGKYYILAPMLDGGPSVEVEVSKAEHDRIAAREPKPTPWQAEPFSAFHWPDHVIGKRESRRIRNEHNALYNSHAELVAAAQRVCQSVNGSNPAACARQHSADLDTLRAALAKVPASGDPRK